MTARVDYLLKSRNRCVIAYTSDGTGGDANFFVGPSAFNSTATNPSNEYPIATTGLTFTSAALSRVVASCNGTTGYLEFTFSGSTPYLGFVIPYQSYHDKNFERFTIPNLAAGSTGMAQIKNTLGGGATASVIMEFVTRHV